jgi:MFS family permease
MTTARPATFRDVFAVAEWRALFGSFVLSTVGDELARVALTVLVYARTGSPLLSALTFAISYLPWVLGGPVLSALADRLPRHRVLITTDLARAVVVGVMVVPGLPLPVLLGLLVAVSLGAPPFESARSALQADVLDDDRYTVAASVSNVSLQLTSVIGFVVGGALVALIGPRAALAFDALTFLVSALWLALALQRRPAAAGDDAGASLWQQTAAGVRHLAGNPRARALALVVWVGAFFTYAPEGLAVPLTAQLGGSTTDVGILLAANPLGVTVGGLVIARLVAPDRRERLVRPLVLVSLGLLAVTGVLARTLPPGPAAFAVVVALSFACGLTSCWFIPVQALFVTAVPAPVRGRAIGIAVSGLAVVQGLGVLVAGVLAERLPPSDVVTTTGLAGLVAVLPALVGLGRNRPVVAAGQPGAGASVA